MQKNKLQKEEMRSRRPSREFEMRRRSWRIKNENDRLGCCKPRFRHKMPAVAQTSVVYIAGFND